MAAPESQARRRPRGDAGDVPRDAQGRDGAGQGRGRREGFRRRPLQGSDRPLLGHVARRHVRRVPDPAGLQADRLRRRSGSVSRLTIEERTKMAKAYWISTYRSISNPDALAAYAKLAGPALTAAGGRFLARGLPAQVYEAGLQQRTVLLEFDSVEAARAAHDSPAYQEALPALAGGADRDIRIV